MRKVSLKEILCQVRHSYENKHFYICLYCLFSLIDVCSKNEFKKDATSGGQYIQWVNKYFHFDKWSGEKIYDFRNSIIHYSSSEINGHNQKINGVFCFEYRTEKMINLSQFIKSLIEALESWNNDKNLELDMNVI